MVIKVSQDGKTVALLQNNGDPFFLWFLAIPLLHIYIKSPEFEIN